MAHNQGGRPQAKVKKIQVDVGLNVIVPILKKSGAIPQALQNIIDVVTKKNCNKTEKQEKLRFSMWMVDKFLPTLTDLSIDQEVRSDFGEQIDGLYEMFSRRLSIGSKKESEGNGAEPRQEVYPEVVPRTN